MSVQAQAGPAAEPFHSLEWMHQFRDVEIHPKLRACAHAMMSYANARGEFRPTLAQLALRTPSEVEWRTVASESSVKRYRGQLVRLGWIELVKKGDGRGNASVYRLSFPARSRITEVKETGSETGSAPLQETGSGVTHQERHQEQLQDQVQESGRGGD